MKILQNIIFNQMGFIFLHFEKSKESFKIWLLVDKVLR